MFEAKELIVFDFDGTLIDSVPDLAGSVNYMLASLGRKTYEEAVIRTWIGNGASKLVKRALCGGEEVEDIDEDLFDKALEIFLTRYEAHICDKTYLYPNVAQTLAILKRHGKKIAIVTNKPSAFIEPILSKLGIKRFVDIYLGADDVRLKKPHPEPLVQVCQKTGIAIERAIMVGDSKNDIEAAKGCRMQSVAVSYGYNYGEDVKNLGADAVVENIEEVVRLLGIVPKVAVVGGGVAGSSVALHLGGLGADVHLFEKNATLVDGPPMCHLHAGGNLYPDISNQQCLQLLRESIDLVRLYPHGIDYRPTVFAVPIYNEESVEDLLQRLELLKREYARLVKIDEKNKVLGEVEEYFTLFSKEELETIASLEQVENPQTPTEWMIPFAKEVDFEQIKFPVLFVHEFGLNVFRIAASATLMARTLPNLSVHLRSEVVDVQKEEGGFCLVYEKEGQKHTERFDYLINAAGFLSGTIDDMLGLHRERFVEFKAAYVTKWERNRYKWPEVIFHGKRATPQGMAQFTPYPGGYFQLHAMTKEVTLFEDGLVKNSQFSAQPKLDERFIQKIYGGWSEKPLKERTKRAISHLCRFIESFGDAKVGAKPLYGAQQIPGRDDTLRAAEVSFGLKNYARCEIVKASSVVAMAQSVTKQLYKLGFFQNDALSKRFECYLEASEVENLAKEFAKERGYPEVMGQITTLGG